MENEGLEVIVYKMGQVVLGFGSETDAELRLDRRTPLATPVVPSSEPLTTIPITGPPSPLVPQETPGGDAEAEARLEAIRVGRRRKKAHRKERQREEALDTDAAISPRATMFITNAQTIHAASLNPLTLSHQSTGYTGSLDRGQDFSFLNGSAAERLDTLRGLGYQFVASPDISL